jgi:hypothetical protein
MKDLLFGVEKMPPKTISEKTSDTSMDMTNPAYVAWLDRD